MMMMGLDSKMGFSEGLVMMMMIKGLDDDDGKIGYWLSYEIDYVHRFDEDNDEKDFFFLGWCVVYDEDYEEADGRRRKKMNNTNPNIFFNLFNRRDQNR